MIFELKNENCLDTMRCMEDSSVDAIVTDPPYGLGSPPPVVDVLRAWLSGEAYRAKGGGFMGKEWDAFVPGPEIWRECFRVLKPGGHLLSFFGTRTYHLGSLAVEIAGFEVRDQIAWVYGTGFPKGKNISKEIDRVLGAEREVVGKIAAGYAPMKSGHANKSRGGMSIGGERSPEIYVTVPATKEAAAWDGWNTALKPAFEPILVARKPCDGIVVENVLKHGTGAMNIDRCRIGVSGGRNNGRKQDSEIYGKLGAVERVDYGKGRYPANLVHDGSEEVMAMFPNTVSGKMTSSHKRSSQNEIYGKIDMDMPLADTFGDRGSAARFFYCAKADRKERGSENKHVTVKPIDLMRWLVRLVASPGGLVYDPFAGSGTTLIAAHEEGFSAVGSEIEAQYCDMFRKRVRERGLTKKLF